MENSITISSLANQMCAHQTRVDIGQKKPLAFGACYRKTDFNHFIAQYYNIVLNQSAKHMLPRGLASSKNWIKMSEKH